MESRQEQPRERRTTVRSPSTVVELQEVMRYQNPNVVERFMVDHDASAEHAAALFEDTKRWMWLCATARRAVEAGDTTVPPMTIFDEQKELDEMWHTFVLFTPDYMEFCARHFGRYIHHAPTPEHEKRAFAAKSEEEKEAVRRDKSSLFRRMAEYVFDSLGADVARRWYLPAQ